MPTWNDINATFNLNNSAKAAMTINANWNFAPMGGGNVLVRDPGVPPLGAHTTYSIGGVGAINAGRAADIINEATTLCVGTGGDDHTSVKTYAVWRTLYGYAPRPVNKIDNAGAVGVYLGVNTIPCHYCGIVLPVELIQIDHQKPKAAGSRGAAILKVLHSLPSALLMPTLTTGIHSGSKGGQAGAIVASLGGGLGGVAVINPKNRIGFGVAFGAAGLGGVTGGGAAKDNQYSLTPQGITLLTIWRMLAGVNGVEMTCVNNILNLVPACAFCNGTNGKGSQLFAK